MTDLEPILKAHPFFAEMPDPDLKLITGCAKNARFDIDASLARQGDPADQFFLIREGRIAIEIPSPQGGGFKIETVDSGEVVGYSWLFPPHIWQFDLRAVTPVRALAMDGRCLRGKCDADPRLGYDLMKRFSRVLSERIVAARLQMADLCGKQPLSEVARVR